VLERQRDLVNVAENIAFIESVAVVAFGVLKHLEMMSDGLENLENSSGGALVPAWLFQKPKHDLQGQDVELQAIGQIRLAGLLCNASGGALDIPANLNHELRHPDLRRLVVRSHGRLSFVSRFVMIAVCVLMAVAIMIVLAMAMVMSVAIAIAVAIPIAAVAIPVAIAIAATWPGTATGRVDHAAATSWRRPGRVDATTARR
jgi:hypothetical protein